MKSASICLFIKISPGTSYLLYEPTTAGTKKTIIMQSHFRITSRKNNFKQITETHAWCFKLFMKINYFAKNFM